MILQTDKDLFAKIRKYGCYLMSLIKVAVDRGGLPEPSADTVNFLYETFFKSGWINGNCLIKEPVKILKFFGVHVSQVIGEHGEVAVPPTYKPFPGEIEVLCYSMPTYSHFVLPDYDPWGGSPAVTQGRLDSKRIFRPDDWVGLPKRSNIPL